MRLIDTHAHLNDRKFARDLPEVIARATKAGVQQIIVCGYDVASSKRAVDISSAYEPVYATLGVHPHDARTYNPQTERELRRLASMPKVVAVGETGLDYHYDFSPRPDQIAAFRAHINLAAELGLPLVVHSREAHDETMQVIVEGAANIPGCVFHCFSGSEEFAQGVLNVGFHIGFDGPVTFPTAEKLRRIATLCPVERILIETDCPYLAPVPHRGARNEPAYVRYVAEAVAAAKGVSVDLIAEATTANAIRLFRIEVKDEHNANR